MAKQTVYTATCSKCRTRLPRVSRRVRQLEDELAAVKQRNVELEAELGHKSSHNAVLLDVLNESSKGPFLGSIKKQVFHRPECKWAQFLLNSRSKREFETHEEAVRAGYKPCKTCRS